MQVLKCQIRWWIQWPLSLSVACSIRVLNEGIKITSRTLGVLRTTGNEGMECFSLLSSSGRLEVARATYRFRFRCWNWQDEMEYSKQICCLNPKTLRIYTSQLWLSWKILKAIYVFPSLLENSKPTLSSERIKFTGKIFRGQHSSNAGRQPGMSCPEMFQGQYLSLTFQKLAIALPINGINIHKFLSLLDRASSW